MKDCLKVEFLKKYGDNEIGDQIWFKAKDFEAFCDAGYESCVEILEDKRKKRRTKKTKIAVPVKAILSKICAGEIVSNLTPIYQFEEKKVSLDKIVQMVKGDLTLSTQIGNIRTCQSKIEKAKNSKEKKKWKTKKDELKKKLLKWQVAGSFTGLKKTDIKSENLSGLVVLDYDDLDYQTMEEVKKKLQGWEFTKLLFTSASGDGLKLIVHTNISDVKDYSDFHDTIAEHLKENVHHKLVADQQGNCINLGTLLSSDSNLYFNENAAVWTELKRFEKPKVADPSFDVGNTKITNDEIKTKVDVSKKQIEEMLSFLNPDLSYKDWFKVGMALIDWGATHEKYRKDAFPLFNEWSKKSKDKYDETETESSFQKWIKQYGNTEKKVTLGSLVHLARENGWKGKLSRPKKVIKNDLSFDHITGFNNSSNLMVKSMVYQETTELVNGSNETNISFIEGIKMYELSFGPGQKAKYMFSNKTLPNGAAKIFLEKAPSNLIEKHLKEYWSINGTKSFAKLLRDAKIKIPTKAQEAEQDKPEADYDEALKIAVENEGNWFYLEGLPINKEKLKQIKNVGSLVRKALQKNFNYDKELLLSFLSDIPMPEPTKITPESYANYNPHKILTTGSQAGKSSMAKVVSEGEPSARTSIAGLMGYGAGKTNKSQGRLDRSIGPIYIEELQESKQENKLGDLLLYLSHGSAEVTHAQRVLVKGHGHLVFNTNPKIYSDQVQLVQVFQRLVGIISDNTEALAARFGLLLFNPDTARCQGKPLNPRNAELMDNFVSAISKAYVNEFTQLFYDNQIVSWLNTEFDSEYQDLIKNIMISYNGKNMKSWLRGHLKAYPRVRSVALRLAWIHSGIDMINSDKFDSEVFLESCNEWLNEVNQINLNSFRTINKLYSGETGEQLIKYEFDSIRYDYVKSFVFNCYEFLLKRSEQKKYAHINEVRDYFRDSAEVFKQFNPETKYSDFSRMINALNKNLAGNKLDEISNILERFGLHYCASSQLVTFLEDQINLNGYLSFYENNLKKGNNLVELDISNEIVA